jgi:hypothetical protein
MFKSKDQRQAAYSTKTNQRSQTALYKRKDKILNYCLTLKHNHNIDIVDHKVLRKTFNLQRQETLEQKVQLFLDVLH